MNLFNAFNFAKLIKTFIPGFIICASLYFYYLLLNQLITGNYFGLLISDLNLVLLILSIPLSIIFGLLSNTVFFTTSMNYLVINSQKKKYPDFFKLEEIFYELIINEVHKKGFFKIKLDELKKNIDIKAFLLKQIEVDKIAFIKDSYFNYLNFQINMIHAIIILTPALIWLNISYLAEYNIKLIFVYCSIIIIILFAVIILFFLLKAAKKNYIIHKKKYLSLLISSYLI